MYAERKNIALQDVQVRLSHRRRARDNEGDQESLEQRIDEIQGQITLVGHLDEAQRNRLLQIATKCWMYRSLSTGVNIHYTQAEE